MKNQLLRVGLIGCGSITHFIHIPGLLLSPDVKLVAACDSSEAAARTTAEKYAIPKVTCDYHEVLQDADIDAVIVATPNDLHKPIGIEALAAGKHILCEKPLGLNSSECDEMVAAAQTAGKVNVVSFGYRFTPAMRYM